MDLLRVLSGISGMTEPRETKLVELKVGQVVRGVLLKMLSEQEGMVSIAGVPVRARLETPLRPGEATLLQVQPESGNGEVVLKPLAGSGTPIPDRSMADLLNWLGLRNNAANRLLVQAMHQAGLPMDRETVRAMEGAAAARPEGTPADEWLTAAATARTKGLPLTRETVQALHAALFGKPPGETIQALRGALAEWLQDAGNRRDADPHLVRTAERLLALLDETAGTPAERLAKSASEQGNRAGGERQAAGVSQGSDNGAGRTAPVRSDTAAAGEMRASSATAGVQAREGVPPQSGPAGAGGRAMTAAPASSGEVAEARGPVQGEAAVRMAGVPVRTPPGPSAQAAPDGRGAAAMRQAAPVVQQATGGNAQAAPSSAAADAARPDMRPAARTEPWLAQLFRDLGFEHERQLLERVLHGAPAGESSEAVRESVKGHILTLQQSEARLPPALREALQQTLQTITGQQLLIAADRQAPFAVVTLSIPLFKSESGEQSATVHIQARRRKGESLDAANCRLLFDLNLARLGPLLMDVQVVDNMVSVKVHSDHPAADLLLESGRNEAEEALSGIGYRLISLRHHPFPEPSGDGKGGKSGLAEGAPAAFPAGRRGLRLNSQPYKGVDVRI